MVVEVKPGEEAISVNVAWTVENVITSYSIHYTKLYESLRVGVEDIRQQGIIDVVVVFSVICGNALKNVDFIEIASQRLPGNPVPVITSYSIHYTKLYEHAEPGRPHRIGRTELPHLLPSG